MKPKLKKIIIPLVLIVAIAAHFVICWRFTSGNEYGQSNVDEWTDIVAVSTGYDSTIGLKSDGTVVATGDSLWDKIHYETCKISRFFGIS